MKTLYLGCSHSAGVWNDNEKVEDDINSVPYLLVPISYLFKTVE